MNKVIAILMRREGLTQEEATDLFEEAKEMFYSCIEAGDYTGAEDVLEGYLGIEPDYVDYFI